MTAARRTWAGVAISLLVAVAAACGAPDVAGEGGAAGTEANQVQRENRGDTSVVRTLRFERHFAELVEELTIGVFEGEHDYMFGSVGWLSTTPDGSIYLYDNRFEELRHYDSEGRFVRRLGRTGEGPGEYQQVTGVRGLDDGGVAIWDPRALRFTVWAGSGDLLWTRLVPAASLFTSKNSMAPATGDRLVFRSSIRTSEDQRDPRATRPAFLSVPGAEAPLDTILAPYGVELEVFEALVVSPTGFSTYRLQTPLSPRLSFEPYGEDGVVVSNGRDYQIDRVAGDGSVLSIRVDAEPVTVLPDEATWQKDRALSGARSVNPSWDWEGPPVPDVKPFIRDIYVGEGGGLWVHVHQPAVSRDRQVTNAETGAVSTRTSWTEPRTFDVFRPDGTYRWTVRQPEDVYFEAFRDERVWGVFRDSLGVAYVKRYRVEGGDR